MVKGKQASLSCLYGLPEKVQQVLWKKVAERGVFQEVASFAKRSDPVIEEMYADRTSLTRSLSDSYLTFYPVKTEDEGCYTCQFHTYPEGTKSATSCLTVFGTSLINYIQQKVMKIMSFCVLGCEQRQEVKLRIRSCFLIGHELTLQCSPMNIPVKEFDLM